MQKADRGMTSQHYKIKTKTLWASAIDRRHRQKQAHYKFVSVKGQITGSIAGIQMPPHAGCAPLPVSFGFGSCSHLKQLALLQVNCSFTSGLISPTVPPYLWGTKTRSQPSTLHKVLKYKAASPVSLLRGVWCSLLVESPISQRCMILSLSKSLSGRSGKHLRGSCFDAYVSF